MSNKTEKVTRKLRAILSADVKGYSLLMAEDEAHTIETLKKYRQIMFDTIKQHTGRVVDNPGDNLLSEFSSAVDAVEAAVQIQNRLKKENAKFVEDKRLEFRIGVNIGDVVHDSDHIYGSGINVAARIEGIADPGGLCISRSTYDQVKDKLDLGFEYLGEHEVKNIKEPVRVYKILLNSDSEPPLATEQLELPDKPSIAVLPLDNMSGDPSQEYFSDGLTEQIISGLCKIPELFVIARNSSFAYKNKSISIKQIGQELGVRYILEGSVQRAGDRVRITVQLIDATTDYHMWSKSYDKDLSDIFALQDEITMKLLLAMMVNLTSGKQALIYENSSMNIEAFDLVMRGLQCFFHFNGQDNARARNYFEQASNLDANSAMAFTMLGWTHFLDFAHSWSNSPLESFVKSEEIVNKALALDDSIDIPHTLLGYIYLYKKEYNKAIEEGKKAVVLNPNGADSLAHLGYIALMLGEIKAAISNLEKAFRLNPIPLSYYYHFLGMAYYYGEQYEKAIEIINQGLSIDSEVLTPYPILICCYSELNRFDEVKETVKRVLEVDPTYSTDYQKSISPMRNQLLLDKYINTLRKAGLPD